MRNLSFLSCPVILIILHLINVSSGLSPLLDPDYGLSTTELINSRGFTAETHFVTTPDGYILRLHRLVHPRIRPEARRGPIICQHGFVGASVHFLIGEPGGHIDEPLLPVGNNLGFELAKRGFDVWLPNTRGSTGSTNHTFLDPVKDRKRFWDYSYDEISAIDQPTIIAYILKTTGRSRLGFIGHSEGTTEIFILLSERPEYTDIIQPFISLSPVVPYGWIPTLYAAGSYNKPMLDVIEAIGGPLPINKPPLIRIASELCSGPGMKSLCSNIFFMIEGGVPSPNLNMTRLPIGLVSQNYSESWKNVLHFAQNIRHKRFAKYDYGPIENLRRYGSWLSPEYKVEKIISPHMAIFTGAFDSLSEPDYLILLAKLKVPLLEHVQVPYLIFNHFDFLWAKTAGIEINSKVLKILDKYY